MMTEKSSTEDPVLYQELAAFWEQHICPKCQVENWTYHSHSQRAFPENFAICRCWKCKVRYWIGLSQAQAANIYFDNPEHVRTTDGREFPHSSPKREK